MFLCWCLCGGVLVVVAGVLVVVFVVVFLWWCGVSVVVFL